MSHLLGTGSEADAKKPLETEARNLLETEARKVLEPQAMKNTSGEGQLATGPQATG